MANAISLGVLICSAESINGTNPAAGNHMLPGQFKSFFDVKFLSPSSEPDGIVKKKGPHNPAQGYEGSISINCN